jgi:hypothetical protein
MPNIRPKDLVPLITDPNDVEDDHVVILDRTTGGTRGVTIDVLRDALGGGTGDITGPGASTDHAISRWVGADGDELEDSGVLIDDNDNVTIPGAIDLAEQSPAPTGVADHVKLYAKDDGGTAKLYYKDGANTEVGPLGEAPDVDVEGDVIWRWNEEDATQFQVADHDFTAGPTLSVQSRPHGPVLRINSTNVASGSCAFVTVADSALEIDRDSLDRYRYVLEFRIVGFNGTIGDWYGCGPAFLCNRLTGASFYGFGCVLGPSAVRLGYTAAGTPSLSGGTPPGPEWANTASGGPQIDVQAEVSAVHVAASEPSFRLLIKGQSAGDTSGNAVVDAATSAYWISELGALAAGWDGQTLDSVGFVLMPNGASGSAYWEIDQIRVVRHPMDRTGVGAPPVVGDVDAGDVDFTPAAGVAATDVQAAIEEVAGDVTAHLADSVDAHDASAISFSPGSGLSSTDAQAAIVEVKTYADALVQGLSAKKSVRVATIANLNLSNALENGDSLDGITLATGDRVLVKDQSSGAENGIYVVQASGAAVRATDFDVASEVEAGAFVFVESGSTHADSGWVLTTDGAITVGTTALAWVQFSGAGQITAGAGLTKSGNTINAVANGDGSIVVNADDIQVGALGAARVLAGLALAAADVDVNAQKIIDVADPTAAQHAATKAYVDLHDKAAPTVLAGTSMTVADSDHGKIFYCTAATTITITWPSGLTPGVTVGFVQEHATAQVQFAASGTTLRHPATFDPYTAEQWSLIAGTVKDTDEIYVYGDLDS